MGGKDQPVSGYITWEGAPIEDGQVVLIPTEGSGQPVSGKISSGSFSLKARPGNYKVQVFATRARDYDLAHIQHEFGFFGTSGRRSVQARHPTRRTCAGSVTVRTA